MDLDWLEMTYGTLYTLPVRLSRTVNDSLGALSAPIFLLFVVRWNDFAARSYGKTKIREAQLFL